jgi:hypothetical protein
MRHLQWIDGENISLFFLGKWMQSTTEGDDENIVLALLEKYFASSDRVHLSSFQRDMCKVQNDQFNNLLLTTLK